MMGASLAHPQKLFIGVFGDLAFFYDLNVIGNRHIGNNVRILLINNGRGNEFRNYGHPCYFLGDEADKYVAAAGHYGNKSPILVKHYATDLGYKYLSAANKIDFISALDKFLSPEIDDKPILFEVFTEKEDESNALQLTLNTVLDKKTLIKQKVKNGLQKVVGENGVQIIKK